LSRRYTLTLLTPKMSATSSTLSSFFTPGSGADSRGCCVGMVFLMRVSFQCKWACETKRGQDAQRLMCVRQRTSSDGCLWASACRLLSARPIVHALVKGFDDFIGRVARCNDELRAMLSLCIHHCQQRESAVESQRGISSQERNLLEVPGSALWIEFCARCQ